MAKAKWLRDYELECYIENIVININEHKRPVFTIDTPGVEGNQNMVLPKDSCNHEWRLLGLNDKRQSIAFSCIWCSKWKYVKLELNQNKRK